jgi:hypothetical protein
MSDTVWNGVDRRQSTRQRQLFEDLFDRVATLETRLDALAMQTTLVFDTVAQLRRELQEPRRGT